MGGPQDDIHRVRMPVDDGRHGPQHRFDPLVRGKEPEGEQDFLALHPELVFEEAGIDERRVRNAVMDEYNLLFGHAVDIRQKIERLVAHDHQPVRQLGQRAHDAQIFGFGIFQHRVERRHHRHAQIPQEFQQMTAGRAAVYAVFMLDADNIGAADIDELRHDAVVAQFRLVDLEAYLFRIRITFLLVVHGRRPAIDVGRFRSEALHQVGGKGRDAAPAGQIVADDGNRFNSFVRAYNR